MSMKKTGTPVKATLTPKASAEKFVKKMEAESEKAMAVAVEKVAVEKDEPPKTVAVPTTPMEFQDATVLQLAQERVLNAQLHLQARQKELQDVLLQVKTKYEAGGRFTLTAIDIPQGTVTRVKN